MVRAQPDRYGPRRYAGAARRVYPGFVQLASFMSMNPERHEKAHSRICSATWSRATCEKAEPIYDLLSRIFRDDGLPAEFYLQTMRACFRNTCCRAANSCGTAVLSSRAAIRRTALFTVEGEKDDICAIGQTLAAHELCSGMRPYLKQHHMQTGVGHYGVFNGRRWEGSIYPRLRELIHMSV